MSENNDSGAATTRRPVPGLEVMATFAGFPSARVVIVGEQEKPVGHDPNYFDRAAWAAVVKLSDGTFWNTKVWWTGARWSFHCTGPHFTPATLSSDAASIWEPAP